MNSPSIRTSERVATQAKQTNARVAQVVQEKRQRMLLENLAREPTDIEAVESSSRSILHVSVDQLAPPEPDDTVVFGELELFNPTPQKKQRTVKKKVSHIGGTNRTLSWLQAIEDVKKNEPSWVPSFLSATVTPSSKPPRRFCLVCGSTAPYNCVRCGTPFCSVLCLETHKDTRCLKWA